MKAKTPHEPTFAGSHEVSSVLRKKPLPPTEELAPKFAIPLIKPKNISADNKRHLIARPHRGQQSTQNCAPAKSFKPASNRARNALKFTDIM